MTIPLGEALKLAVALKQGAVAGLAPVLDPLAALGVHAGWRFDAHGEDLDNKARFKLEPDAPSDSGVQFGLPVQGRVSSSFGERMHPTLHRRKLHTGIDIAAPTGTPILAPAGGRVIAAGWRGGYGNTVLVDHGNGLTSLYGHMSGISVGVGDRVAAGTTLGRVGTTGRSTGPHVHYEVRRDGVPVDPVAD